MCFCSLKYLIIGKIRLRKKFFFFSRQFILLCFIKQGHLLIIVFLIYIYFFYISAYLRISFILRISNGFLQLASNFIAFLLHLHSVFIIVLSSEAQSYDFQIIDSFAFQILFNNKSAGNTTCKQRDNKHTKHRQQAAISIEQVSGFSLPSVCGNNACNSKASMALNRSTKIALTVQTRRSEKVSTEQPIHNWQTEWATDLRGAHIDWPCPRDGRSPFQFICAIQKQNNNVNSQITCMWECVLEYVCFRFVCNQPCWNCWTSSSNFLSKGNYSLYPSIRIMLTQLFSHNNYKFFILLFLFYLWPLRTFLFAAFHRCVYFTLSAANVNSWDDCIETHSMCAQLISDQRLGLNARRAFLRMVFTM